MQDAAIAGVLCLLGLGAIIVAAIFAFSQKTYVDRSTGVAVTEIEVPLFGKLRTNTPAIALCFVGLGFGYLAYDLMKGRGFQLVPFHGEITVDQVGDSAVDLIMVGITSGAWIQQATPGTAERKIPVVINVPNSFSSYTAFAFGLGNTKTKPAIIGSTLDDPNFKLSIRP